MTTSGQSSEPQEQTVADSRKRLARQLDIFRSRLLSTDARSPTIFLGRLTKAKHLDVSPSKPVSELCLARGANAPADVALVLDRDETDAAAALRTGAGLVARTAAACLEETGIQALHVGLCWVDGPLASDIYVRAPLLLMPCRLQRQPEGRNAGWYLRFEEDGPLLNAALAALLKSTRGFEFPPDFEDRLATMLDGAKHDRESWPRVLELLEEVAFPASGGMDVVEPFVSQTKREALAVAGGLRLVPYAVLGLFQLSSSTLHTDIGTMIDRASAGELDQGIVDNILDVPADDPARNEANFVGRPLDEVSDAQLNLVTASDPSQDAVVLRAGDADCIVVRGPPGTGKSQVIVNLIADAMSHHHRVALVCQKRVALDVVRDRLSKVGLGDAAFLLHDPQADLKSIYKQLAARMAASGAEPANEEAKVRRLSAEVDEKVAELRALGDALRADVHGVRVSTLYARAPRGQQCTLKLGEQLASMRYDELPKFTGAVGRAQSDYLRYDVASSALAHRKSWADLDGGAIRGLRDTLQRLVERAEAVREAVHVADPTEGARLAASAGIFLELQSKWYRVVLPRWYDALAVVARRPAALGSHPPATWSSLIAAGAALAEAIDSLAPFFRESWIAGLKASIASPGVLAAQARTLLAQAEEFHAVQEYDRSTPPHVRALTLECSRHFAAEADWGELLGGQVLLAWIDEAERRYPALRGDPLARYEKLRAQLDETLREKQGAVVRDLPKYLRNLSGPQVNLGATKAQARSANSRWSKLRHEVEKQRRLWPLRKLVHEFDAEVRDLARCWLCLPEVVSDVFPLTRDYFDLVIFDEASQLAVERSLPVLYRAKRVVIAGDEQQMPPSNFFTRQTNDELPEEDASAEAEATRVQSLLEAAKRIYGFTHLEWHYRSEHQELIDFSNHAFYDGKLQVAANITCGDVAPPIRWTSVPGIWSQNRNLREVAAVVDLVREELLASRDEHRSVGVITFNEAQCEAIKLELERRIREDPAFAEAYGIAEARPDRDERPMVKNIENVQGDERDVIIFSIGYADGPDGKFRRHFGPLSAPGGENRLNVAVTRARRRVHVVCSFDPNELAVDQLKNLGPVRLQQYLRYAKAVSEKDAGALAKVRDELAAARVEPGTRELRFDSPFEEEVYERLVRAGYTVMTQWGFSGYRIDLAVVHPSDPQRFCLGIECDGEAFHSARSVRERDVARQRFLERRGWKIARVWSRTWWQSPERETARLLLLLPPLPSGAVAG